MPGEDEVRLRLPIAALERAARGQSHESIPLVGYPCERAVHRIGDFTRLVAGEVLPQCGAEHLAARTGAQPCEALGTCEHVIGNRHGRFHTASVTRLLTVGFRS